MKYILCMTLKVQLAHRRDNNANLEWVMSFTNQETTFFSSRRAQWKVSAATMITVIWFCGSRRTREMTTTRITCVDITKTWAAAQLSLDIGSADSTRIEFTVREHVINIENFVPIRKYIVLSRNTPHVLNIILTASDEDPNLNTNLCLFITLAIHGESYSLHYVLGTFQCSLLKTRKGFVLAY